MKVQAVTSRKKKISMDGDYLFDCLKSISLVIFIKKFFFFWVMNMMNTPLALLSVFPAASHANWYLRKF